MTDDQVAAQIKILTDAVSKLRNSSDSLARSAKEITGQHQALRRNLDSLRDQIST